MIDIENKFLTLKYLPAELGIRYGKLRKKLIDLEIIARPLGQSEYLLTDLALFYELGEIRRTTIQTGYKKRYVVYNVDNLRDILRYNMPLSELYENMYPEDAIADAPRDDDLNDGY